MKEGKRGRPLTAAERAMQHMRRAAIGFKGLALAPVTENSLTVFAEEKESGYEVECHSPFELGTRNIDWLHEMYEVVWRQLEGKENVEPETEKS